MIDRKLEKSLARCRQSGGRHLTLPPGQALDRFDWRLLLECILFDFPRLETLNLATARIDEAELSRFLHRLHRCELAEIDLSQTPISNCVASSLASSLTAGNLPNLSKIGLANTFITDDGFKELFGAATAGFMHSLQWLDFADSLITDVGLSAFARAIEKRQVPNIWLLQLDGTVITARGLTALIDAGRNGQLKKLQRLSLSDMQITAYTLKVLSSAASTPHLNGLHCIEFHVSHPNKVEIIARAAEAGCLGFLDNVEICIDGRSRAQEDLPAFALVASIRGRHSLQNLLSVFGVYTRAQVVRFMDTVLNGSIMKRIWSVIRYGNDTGISIRALIRVLASDRVPGLTLLSILDSCLTEKELDRLGQVLFTRGARNLTSLWIGCPRVTDSFIGSLSRGAEKGNLQHLKNLSLYKTAITDVGLQFLSSAIEAGSLPQLKELDIRKTEVSVDSAVIESCKADEIIEWLGRPTDSYADVRLREAKLIVLGQGGSGKSAVCQRVVLNLGSKRHGMRNDADAHGYEFVMGKGPERITFRLWDFGGQDHLHGTHRFVVGAERALYLLIVDAARSAEVNRLDYWLRFLAHHGSMAVSGQVVRAPVILVRTKSGEAPGNTAGMVSAERAGYVMQDTAEWMAALEAARENDWYGANVVEIIDGVGCDESDVSVLGTTCDRAGRQDGESDRLRDAICEHTERIIGINNRVPVFALKIRDWIKEHFEASVFSDVLAHFQYDKAPFVDFLRAEGLDRDKSGRTHNELGRSLVDLRVPAALTLLKSLGLVHWNGDMAEAVPNPDSVLRRRVINPRWIKTPISRLISVPAVDYPNGWIDRNRLETKLLPVRKPAMNARQPGNDFEWFEQLGMSSEERGHIVEIMTDYGIAFPIATSRQQGILIPDCLGNVDVAWNPSPEMFVAEYRSDFLSDRMLLQFLAHQVERTISKDREIPRGLARNWAKLVWDEAGTAFDVLIHIDLCPPSGELPRLRIAVGGGLPEGRATVLAAIKKEIELFLAANSLPPLIEETQPMSGGFAPVTRALRKPRRRFDPEIADIKVRKYLDSHPNASPKIVADAAGIAIGQLPKLRSWKERRGRQRGENRKPARPDRQLSDKQFAVLGEKDSGFVRIDELDSFRHWLGQQRDSDRDRETIASLSNADLLAQMEVYKEHYLDCKEDPPWLDGNRS